MPGTGIGIGFDRGPATPGHIIGGAGLGLKFIRGFACPGTGG